MKTYQQNAFAGVIPNTLHQRRIIFLFILLSLSIVAFSNTNSVNAVDTSKPVQFNLPLVLLSFNVSFESSKQVKVEWATGSEKDLANFVVQRSIDGKIYVDAGTVNASGTSTVKKLYKFTEKIGPNFPKGVVYYRLKMIDTENRYQNSTVSTIKIDEDVFSGVEMVAYPNPVVNELKISIPASWQRKDVSYDVYNLNGVLLKHKTTKAYSQTEVVGMQEFGTGVYLVKASTDTESAMQRIVKR